MINIDYRFDKSFDEFYQMSAKIGMVIAEKLTTEGSYKEPRTFPHYDFSYVIFKIFPSGIEVRDTGHNNLWHFSQEDLNGYELVKDWHRNAGDGVADYVNDALSQIPNERSDS